MIKLFRDTIWPRLLGPLRYFLVNQPKDGEREFQASILAGSLLLAVTVIALNLLTFTYLPVNLPILIANLILFLLSSALLYAVRCGVDPSWLVLAFVVMFVGVLAVNSTYVSASFLTPGNFFILLILLTGVLISSGRIAVLICLYTVAATLFIFWKTRANGLEMPFGWSYPVFVRRTQFVVLTSSLVAYCSIAMQEYFRRRAEDRLAQEKEWLVRSARLHEISSLAQTLSLQFAAPLKAFAHEFQLLRSAYGMDAFTEDEAVFVQNMSQTVEHLIQVSRSFDFIYRSGRSRRHEGANIDTLLGHLEILLEGRALESGWTVAFQADEQTRRRDGVLPALMLLVISLAHQTFDGYKAALDICLSIDVKLEDEALIWTFRWPQTPARDHWALGKRPRGELLALVSELRDALINELLKESVATLVARDEGKDRLLILKSPLAHLVSLESSGL